MSRILLFIPMYNCEKQIVRVLKQLTPEIGEHITEAIIVNNRSTDGGEAAVQNYLAESTVEIPVTLLRNDERNTRIDRRGAVRKMKTHLETTHGIMESKCTE